jgi:hypothetical protein
MTQLSKPLEAALAEVAALAPDQQNLIALEVTQRVRALTGGPTKLTPEERAELEAELAAARRGELASDADVAAMFAKHGL